MSEQKGNQDIVQSIDRLSRAVQGPYLSTYSVDANGWEVERIGERTRYTRLLLNPAYGVGAGEQDLSIGVALPVGVTQSMIPAIDTIKCSLYRTWTTVDWNFLIRGWQVASPSPTQFIVSFHVYTSSARSILIGFWVEFII